jgi:hypothetical protein
MDGVSSGTDPVRAYCRDRGCLAHVVSGGLLGLVKGWEASVAYLLEAKRQYLCEFLNDLDGRQILHEALTVALPGQLNEVAERVRVADEQFLHATVPVEECLWGAENAAKHGWAVSVNWWYFRKPAGFEFEW